MKKSILFGLTCIAALAACTDDYKDWAGIPATAQPDVVTFGDGSVSAVSTINLNNVTSETVQVCNITAPTASEADYAPTYQLTLDGDTNFDLTSDGQMATADLQAYIAEKYTQNPIERSIAATVSMWLNNGTTAVKTATSGTFQLKAIPQAPVIEQAYYLTGTINGWDNTDTTYKLTNDGSDPYVNPTFTLRIPAPEDGSDVEFKMTPESGLGGDWSGCLSAGDADGKFAYNNAGGNLVITADPDAIFYDLTFNMLDQTWKATPMGFNEYIYEIGNESGWSENHPLHGDGNGRYTAVHYLNGEFKFKPNKDNWDGDWEKASGDAFAGTLTADGGPNVDGVEAGFYYIEVDLAAMTYKLTPVTAISIIGSVKGSWDTDVDMTYNENLQCWEAFAELNAGEYKFRLNHDWAVNWGGTEDNLVQDGANLTLAEAGEYTVRIFLSDEAPAHSTVSVFPDNIYEIGNESGWGTPHLLKGNGNGQYQGYYYLDGEFKFKPNENDWNGDWENDGDGRIADNGGANMPGVSAGFYRIDVDLAAMTYSVTLIETVSIIGTANGNWDTDTDLTYNKAEGCWEVTCDLNAGEMKFRGNHNWDGDVDLGGSFDSLVHGGSNIAVEAGNYTIKLYISYAGAHHAVVTKN